MKFKAFYALYDFWIGLYYDRKRKILYINPLPTIVLSFASDQNVWDDKLKRWESESKKIDDAFQNLKSIENND